MKAPRIVSTVAGLGIAIGLWAGPAEAALITSPNGILAPMPTLNVFGPGPQTFGPGITWTSTNATHQGGSVFGYTNGYGFAANGFWSGLPPMAGLNDSHDVYGVTDTMTFALSSPVYGIGGLLNYVPGSRNPTTIAVYDSTMTLIESFNLTFLTGGGHNTGSFFEFLETTRDISFFTLTDNYVGITDVTVQAPEPGSLLLLGAGLLGMVAVRSRRR